MADKCTAFKPGSKKEHMQMAATTVGEDRGPSEGSGQQTLCIKDGTTEEHDDNHKLVLSPLPLAQVHRHEPTTNNITMGATASSTSKNDRMEDFTLLVEVVKATIPKRRGSNKRDDKTSRGMHCTATWVGPTNPSGRKRREKLLHRTNTLKIDYKADSSTSSSNAPIVSLGLGAGLEDEQAEEGVDCTEHIFTVDDSSLFLFKTTMKQLVNASINSSQAAAASPATDDDDESASNESEDGAVVVSNGGLRFDIFEKPLDMLNSVYSTVLADNRKEKEDNAVTRESSSSFNSYRLVGSVFLSPEEILSKCDEQRFECDLMENWRKVLQQNQGSNFQRLATKKVDGGKLALRFRVASEFDMEFMNTLAASNKRSTSGVNVALQTTLIQCGSNKKLEPAQLITEVDENVLAAETSIKAIGNMSPVAQESMRYLFSNDTEKRIFVKPHADPANPEETTWFTEEGLQHECYKPSTNWVQAGQAKSNSLGKVYLEVLECRGLPNTDAGGAIGNKTDAFISMVYGDVMAQTEVIDDSCSPMWMPWCSRAFVFQMAHPSTAIYIGVTDYDVGPLEHECIGRLAINLSKFYPGTMYTLTYNLYESSNLAVRGEDFGTITVRLRIEISDEKKYLMMGRTPPENRWVNSQQWKSHRVAKYCVDGPHDTEVFEMALFRSHINELLTQKRHLTYGIKDAVKSLIYWRGQVKIGNVWLPLHSALIYYFSIHVVERPQLLPSFLLFGFGWIMIANMFRRESHPNPWYRGHSFSHHWSVLVNGKARSQKGKTIHPMQGHKEAKKLEAKWNQRIEDDDEQYAKQLELDAKIKSISDDAVIRTKAKANGALVDPIAAVAGAKLLPYQQRLGGYCNQARFIRNVLNWNESIRSFFFTVTLFGAGFVALFIPWKFLLLWTSRLVVWIFLGPWMRLIDLFFHEESDQLKAKANEKSVKFFLEGQKAAKILREHALKMKAFRVKLFGQYITRLPDFNLTRHEDTPLPESSAEPYRSKQRVKDVRKFVPSQDLSGAMIPMTGQEATERKVKMGKEKDTLVGKFQEMVGDTPELTYAPSQEDLDEGYELNLQEDRVVCLHSESEDIAKSIEPKEIIHARCNSERSVVLSDQMVQLALEKELGEPRQKKGGSKTKWIFSAKVLLSLRKEAEQDSPSPPALESSAGPALCDANNLIEHSVEEEGVEIVPLLEATNDGTKVSGSSSHLESESEHVSLFYVKENRLADDDIEINESNSGDGDEFSNCISENSEAIDTTEKKVRFDDTNGGNVTSDVVKRIRFKKTIRDLDSTLAMLNELSFKSEDNAGSLD